MVLFLLLLLTLLSDICPWTLSAPFPPSPHSLLNLVALLTSPKLGKILLVMAEVTIRHFVTVLLKYAGHLLPASFLAPAALLRLLPTSLAPWGLLPTSLRSALLLNFYP